MASSTAPPAAAASTSAAQYAVVHEPKNKRFVIDLGGGDLALIEYAESKSGIELYHTEVPSNHQGKGLAGILARGVFDWAVAAGRRDVLPTCTYLSDTFLPRNPQYESVVQPAWLAEHKKQSQQASKI